MKNRDPKFDRLTRNLQCRLVRLRRSMHDECELFFPPGQCCDMKGAIELCKYAMPEATAIQTFSGDKEEILYLKHEKRGIWEAFVCFEPEELDCEDYE